MRFAARPNGRTTDSTRRLIIRVIGRPLVAHRFRSRREFVRCQERSGPNLRPAKPPLLTKAETSVSQIKTGPRGPVSQKHPAILLDLGLTEFDVLARDRVVLLLDQLVGHGVEFFLAT